MKRLLEEGSAFERELLGSAAGDRMPARARSAAIAAATAGTGIAATKAVTTALRGRSLLSLFGAKGAAVGWVAVTVAVGAAGVAGVVKLERGSSAPASSLPPSPAPAEAAHAPMAAQPQPPPAAPAEAPVSSPARPVAAARPAPAHVRSAAPAASAPAASAPAASAPAGVATLGEQARLIESARQALRAGRPQEALARLDDFDRRYPGDALAEEAAVARIEAVAAVDPAAARPLAAAYLASHPNGAYARVVSRVAGAP